MGENWYNIREGTVRTRTETEGGGTGLHLKRKRVSGKGQQLRHRRRVNNLTGMIGQFGLERKESDPHTVRYLMASQIKESGIFF
jgi:hypothetical protein